MTAEEARAEWMRDLIDTLWNVKGIYQINFNAVASI